MKTMSIAIVVNLTKLECSECHAPFGITEHAEINYRRTHQAFHCPYCNASQYFPQESAVERANRLKSEAEQRLVRERAAFDQEKARLNELVAIKESQRRAEKGAKTKLKKRAAAGVCPCCQRSFENVRRHISHMHPEFVSEARVEATG
jgi:RNase P subunit RPR2